MEELDAHIARIKQLPAAPRIMPELLRLLSQPNIDVSRVVELVAFDPGLTANVLQLCNSAFFAGAVPVADLDDAIGRLGFNPVYQIVAAASGARLLTEPQLGYGINQGELWKHSVTAALAAQAIAQRVGDDANVAFTAALLHDVGKIILSSALEHIYAKLLEETERDQASLLEKEKSLLGVQHAEVGGRLLMRWRFPVNIWTAVAFHHDPKGAAPHERLAATVYLGDMIAHFMGHGYGGLAFAIRGRAEALEILEFEGDLLPHLMIATFEQFQLLEVCLNLNTATRSA